MTKGERNSTRRMSNHTLEKRPKVACYVKRQAQPRQIKWKPWVQKLKIEEEQPKIPIHRSTGEPRRTNDYHDVGSAATSVMGGKLGRKQHSPCPRDGSKTWLLRG